MILVDTSVWIDHLRQGDATLAHLLAEGQVVTHEAVIGELALGNLKNRPAVLGALQNLAQLSPASAAETLLFIETQSLFGKGIGYVDAGLLAALRLNPGVLLWTRDKRLLAESTRLGLSARIVH
ncbi:MAG: type II toxin-antitoxin system VapC family toxin [Gallionella sp.]